MKRILTLIAALLLAPLAALRAGDGFPDFGWDRAPVYAHVGRTADDFMSEQLDFLAKHFDFVTIEKHQASHKHGSTEDGFVVAARETKKRNPQGEGSVGEQLTPVSHFPARTTPPPKCG